MSEKGTVYFFTGLAGAGKTTIGELFYERLKERRPDAVLIDGDRRRANAGHSAADGTVLMEDRYTTQARKDGAFGLFKRCWKLAEQGLDVVVCSISMYTEVRAWNRENIENYREIYLKVTRETLYRRDQKKLYSSGAKNVVGVDLPYDEPQHPSIVIQNDGQETPEEIVDRLEKFFGLAQGNISLGKGERTMENRSLPYLDFEVVNDPAILKDASIALYGASKREGETCAMLRALGLNIVALADTDPEKWGKPFNGLNIISPNEMRSTLLAEEGKKYVISCANNTKEIYHSLSELFQNDDVSVGFISFWGIDFCIHTHREEFAARSKDVAALFEKEKADDFIRYTQISLQQLSELTHKSNEILIFQPGKVGSRSMLKIFQNSDIPCIHIHSLSYPEQFLGTELRPAWEGAVERLRYGDNKIISMVRDPLSRGYSAFWQRFSVESLRYRYASQVTTSLQEMYELLMDRDLHGLKGSEKYGFEFPFLWRDEFEWFDEEVKEYLGLDVYQYPFDREKGYTIIREGSMELFLFKMEKLGSVLPALETFIGEGIRLNLEKDNVASAKTYSMAYQAFREQVCLKKEYVDHYFGGNAKVDHFYTKEEQAQFYQKWENRVQ